MQIIRDPADAAASIADPELRQLIEKTVQALSAGYPYDPNELGYFLIVQPGDCLHTLSGQIGFPIMVNRFSGIQFGHAGFTPSFELVEEHAGYYEMVFIISDDGFGIEVFIPKATGIPPELLAICRKYAVPAKV